MIVKCGVNGEKLEESQLSVCHHCGMPVCEQHGWVVVSDDAFAGSAEAPTPLPDLPAPPVPAAAPVMPAAPAMPSPAGPAPRATTAPLPAMHCRDCADKFHAGAARRHGWAAHWPAAVGYAGPVGRR